MDYKILVWYMLFDFTFKISCIVWMYFTMKRQDIVEKIVKKD